MTSPTLAPPSRSRNPEDVRGATIPPANTRAEPHPDARGEQHQAVDHRGIDNHFANVGDLVLLRLYSEILADLQSARIAFTNRIGANAIIDQAWAKDRVDGIEREERAVQKMVEQTFLRALPATAQWVADTPGLGLLSVGRLVGQIGHPRIAQPAHYEPNPDHDPDKPASAKNPKRILVADEPYERSVSQLWSYCAVGDPARKRSKGMDGGDALAAGNPFARVLLFRIVDSSLKARRFGSPYALVYDELRARYLEEGWGERDKHRHLSAMRIAGKRFLRDLWITSGLDLAPTMYRAITNASPSAQTSTTPNLATRPIGSSAS